MNKRQLYESIMKNVAREVKKALNEATTGTLNNADAYRFLSIYVVKAIKMTMGTGAVMQDNERGAVKMVLKLDRKRKEVNLTMCYDDKGEVAVSQSKMMYMKNMAFISDGNIYVVSGDLLRENWSNDVVCHTDRKMYNDAIGERSVMTRFNLEFLKDNADDVIELSQEAMEMYDKAYNEMSIK